MELTTLIIIVGVVIAVAGFLFGHGVLTKDGTKKGCIFCGVEAVRLQIPRSLREAMTGILRGQEEFWPYNIFVQNDSKRACMNAILTITISGTVIGHVVNDTNEDKSEVEESVAWQAPRHLLIKLRRLGPKSFVDLSVWALGYFAIVGEKWISLASDSDFVLRTNVISRSSNKDRFR